MYLLIALTLLLNNYFFIFYCSIISKDSVLEVGQISVSSNIPYGNLSIVSLRDDEGTQMFNSLFTIVYDVLKLKVFYFSTSPVT